MPKATVNGNEYFYAETGSGFPVVFGHSLLFDRHMLDHQVETLSSRLLSEFLSEVDSASPK